MATPRFTLLVPVKGTQAAKTRLTSVGEHRTALMTAFAQDAISAALRSPAVEVRVVGDPHVLGALLAGLPVEVVADEGRGDLNEALRRAAARVRQPDRGVAAMLADLPCLRTEDLETALAQGQDERAFVADAAGTGTTLLVAPPGRDLDPRFGAGSAQAHLDSGARPVAGELMSLRLDVDTSDDLARALAFGVGAHTALAVDQARN